MPTENELKFTLFLDSEKEIRDTADSFHEIKQGYLVFSKGMSVRVRDIDGEKFELCFKQRVKNRVIEIEKKLEKRDFEDLWSISVNRLEKIRYYLWHKFNGNKYLWEVDAFKDHHHHTYFFMAEHEMPEGQTEPFSIPKQISENLLFSVPLKDDRFASKRIADVRYAKKLYVQLTKELKNDSERI